MISAPSDTDVFSISFVTSIYQPATVVQRDYSFNEAVKFFTSFQETNKKNSVPAYSGAVYGNTLYRSDANVIAMSAVVVDFDNDKRLEGGTKQCSTNPVRPNDLERILEPWDYFFHSTHSNKPDWPKWRLIVPLHRNASREEWPGVVNVILDRLSEYEEHIDETCFQLSRHFLLPSYSDSNKGAAFAGYCKGKEVFHVC